MQRLLTIIFSVMTPLLLVLQTTFSQTNNVLDTLIAKVGNIKSDTLTIQLAASKTDDIGFDLQKNMPWVGATIIGLLTVFANILISRQTRITTKESLNQQLTNATDIALSQIDNSSKIVQLDFNKTVLSGNRQAWINTLRDAISDYVAKCNSYQIKLDQIKSKGNEAVQNTDITDLTEILRLEKKIVLMLNSNEDDSKLLIENLGKYTTALFKENVITQSPEFYEQAIIDVTKTILKKEWERVKKGE